MGMFEDLIRDNPAFSLEDALWVVWDDYPNDFKAYWGLDSGERPEHLKPDDWLEYRKLEQLVTRMANGARMLVRPRKTPDDQLALYDWLREEASRLEDGLDEVLEKFREKLPSSEWWDIYRGTRPSDPSDPRLKKAFMDACMQIEADSAYSHSPAEMASRLFRLLDHVVGQPGQRCREYLPRVAECYVRGMKLELAVMARSVLDAALQDEYPDDVVRGEVGAGNDVVLERRIQCAASRGPFRDKGVLDAADRIRVRGNRAAHADLELVIDEDAVLDDLTTCLAALDNA